jgi:hypothetical protein
MKLWGWIRSAVEFVRVPAGPRKAGPQLDAPGEIDGRTVEQDAAPDDIETRPESRISVEPESRPTVESGSPISAEPEGSPSQEEIDRRRGIVRKFFNDYWSSIDDKPTSFAERLDGAEGYINERVAAGGEAWRLSPATRKQLGLPPSRKR